MSRGPGRVERAIRALIEGDRKGARHWMFTTGELYRAAFHHVGTGLPIVAAEQAYCSEDEPADDQYWTKAQRVSALRAMHRIMASEAGWKTIRAREELTFVWRPPSPPKQPKQKPQKVSEPIWAYAYGSKRSLVWQRATIVSRGGANPMRVTIDYDGRKLQATDYGKDIHVPLRLSLIEGRNSPSFCHDGQRAEIERQHRDFRRGMADRLGISDGGASPEALAMLGLKHPYTAADVKRAFRAKALKVHPDQGGDHDIQIALERARDAALADADG